MYLHIRYNLLVLTCVYFYKASLCWKQSSGCPPTDILPHGIQATSHQAIQVTQLCLMAPPVCDKGIGWSL